MHVGLLAISSSTRLVVPSTVRTRKGKAVDDDDDDGDDDDVDYEDDDDYLVR